MDFTLIAVFLFMCRHALANDSLPDSKSAEAANLILVMPEPLEAVLQLPWKQLLQAAPLCVIELSQLMVIAGNNEIPVKINMIKTFKHAKHVHLPFVLAHVANDSLEAFVSAKTNLDMIEEQMRNTSGNVKAVLQAIAKANLSEMPFSTITDIYVGQIIRTADHAVQLANTTYVAFLEFPQLMREIQESIVANLSSYVVDAKQRFEQAKSTLRHVVSEWKLTYDAKKPDYVDAEQSSFSGHVDILRHKYYAAKALLDQTEDEYNAALKEVVSTADIVSTHPKSDVINRFIAIEETWGKVINSFEMIYNMTESVAIQLERFVTLTRALLRNPNTLTDTMNSFKAIATDTDGIATFVRSVSVAYSTVIYYYTLAPLLQTSEYLVGTNKEISDEKLVELQHQIFDFRAKVSQTTETYRNRFAEQMKLESSVIKEIFEKVTDRLSGNRTADRSTNTLEWTQERIDQILRSISVPFESLEEIAHFPWEQMLQSGPLSLYLMCQVMTIAQNKNLYDDFSMEVPESLKSFAVNPNVGSIFAHMAMYMAPRALLIARVNMEKIANKMAKVPEFVNKVLLDAVSNRSADVYQIQQIADETLELAKETTSLFQPVSDLMRLVAQTIEKEIGIRRLNKGLGNVSKEVNEGGQKYYKVHSQPKIDWYSDDVMESIVNFLETWDKIQYSLQAINNMVLVSLSGEIAELADFAYLSPTERQLLHNRPHIIKSIEANAVSIIAITSLVHHVSRQFVKIYTKCVMPFLTHMDIYTVILNENGQAEKPKWLKDKGEFMQYQLHKHHESKWIRFLDRLKLKTSEIAKLFGEVTKSLPNGME